jgi:PAS domain S-box-containing protein
VTRFRLRMREPAPPPSAEFAAALVESLSDPVLACDEAGAIVMRNRRARDLLGGTTEAVELPIARALKGEDVRDLQVEVGPNGKRQVVSVSGSAVRGPDGEIRGALIVMTDIGDRATVDDRVRLEGAITANTATGIALIRAADGEIVYVNDALRRMHGYGPGELIGQQISILNGPSDETPEAHFEAVLTGLERDGFWSSEAPKLRKDGTAFWCAVNVSAFVHRTYGAVWVVAETDITERKAAADAVRTADERFRSVFDNAPVGILVVDEDLRVIDANTRFCEMTGYRRDELHGTAYGAIAHPDDAAHEADLLAKLVGGDIPRYRIETRLMSREGDEIRVVQTTTLVRDADGHPLHRIAIVEELRPA